MQPYHAAAISAKEQEQQPIHALQSISKLGGALGAGSVILNRLAPFLNKSIPSDLAVKGISKISPEIGKFISWASKDGKSADELRDFIGSKLQGTSSQETQQPAQEQRNIIEQYSPELHQFISERVAAGEDPLQAGGMALYQKNRNFEPIIRKIEKDHKTNWSSILQTVYGQGNQATQPPQQGGVSPQQTPGPGQQALMEILNRINQRLGQ